MCRVGGENHGADLHYERRKGVGVGFLSQRPRAEKSRRGFSTVPPGAQGKERREMRSKGSAWAASWVAQERERQTRIQRERLEARAE